MASAKASFTANSLSAVGVAWGAEAGALAGACWSRALLTGAVGTGADATLLLMGL